MSNKFRKELDLILKTLKKYKKISVFEKVIQGRTKRKIDSGESIEMPWIQYLLLDYLYITGKYADAREINERELTKVENMIWNLQNAALKINSDSDFHLKIRKILIQQEPYNKHSIFYRFELLRLFKLFQDPKLKEPVEYFAKQNGVSVFEFLELAVYFSIVFERKPYAVSYSQIISDLQPSMDLRKIITVINLISISTEQYLAMLKESKNYVLSRSRYYCDPVQLKSPIMLLKDTMNVIHDSILHKGVAVFLISYLKDKYKDNFKMKFGKAFERYVGQILENSRIEHITEDDIKKIYVENDIEPSTKVPDFCVKEGGASIFIESKAKEPNVVLDFAESKILIRQRLKGSILRGIEQCLECFKNLQAINQEHSEGFIIVITYKDFQLSTGAAIKRYVDDKFFEELKAKYDGIIPEENIHFISIEDFEGVMTFVKKEGVSLKEFLKFCSDSNSRPSSERFNIRQHIVEFSKRNKFEYQSPLGSELLYDARDTLMDNLEETLSKNNSYWKEKGTGGIREYLVLLNTLKSNLG